MIKVRCCTHTWRGAAERKQLKAEETSLTRLQFPAKAAALNYEKSHAAALIIGKVATPNRRCTWELKEACFLCACDDLSGRWKRRETHTLKHTRLVGCASDADCQYQSHVYIFTSLTGGEGRNVIGRGACIAVRVGLVDSTALLCPLRAIVCAPEFAFEKVLAWHIFCSLMQSLIRTCF